MSYPLQYFQQFLTTNMINKLRENFFNEDLHYYSLEEEWIETFKTVKGNEIPYKLEFKTYINQLFQNEVAKALVEIENLLLSFKNEKIKTDKLKNLLLSANELHYKFLEDKELNKYELHIHLNNIVQTIEAKLTLKPTPEGYEKLKWIGTVTQLITIFKELDNGEIHDEKGKPLMESTTPGNMKKILQAIFTTKDGREIESSTFDKYWADSNKIRRKSSVKEQIINSVQKK